MAEKREVHFSVSKAVRYQKGGGFFFKPDIFQNDIFWLFNWMNNWLTLRRNLDL